MSLRAVHIWAALDKVGGLRVLKPKRRGRRPGEGGRLSVPQAQHIRRLIRGKMPDQLKLSFYLWTRAAVVHLIAREYGLTVSLTTVGRYLWIWGMSLQQPVRRTYERNHEAIAQWLSETYPDIAREARRDGARIYWRDKRGLRSDHEASTSYAPLGQTPVIQATGQRFGCNMISAITNRGTLSFMVFHGKFNGVRFVDFLRRLLKQAAGNVYPIVDGHPMHKSTVVTRFVAEHATRLRLFLLPGYCPELNLNELLNQDVKTNALGKSCPTNRPEMMATVRRHLYRRQAQPQLSKTCFVKSMSVMPLERTLRTICWPAQ